MEASPALHSHGLPPPEVRVRVRVSVSVNVSVRVRVSISVRVSVRVRVSVSVSVRVKNIIMTSICWVVDRSVKDMLLAPIDCNSNALRLMSSSSVRS